MRFSDKLRHVLQQSSRLLIAAIVIAAVDAHGQDQAPVLNEECIAAAHRSSDIVCIFLNGFIYSYGLDRDPDKVWKPHYVQPYHGIAIQDGKIIGLYSEDGIKSFEAMKMHLTKEHPEIPDAKIRWVDLNRSAMIPGFVDAHSHFSQVGFLSKWANLLPEPDSDDSQHPVKSIQNIKEILIALKEKEKLKYQCGEDKDDDCLLAKMKDPTNNIKAIIGNGYDDSLLFVDEQHRKDDDPEGHPKVGTLNEVSTKIPVCVFHQSGHYGVCNTAGLNAAGYYDDDAVLKTTKTPDPTGGTIYRDDEDKMTGLLGERAFIDMLDAVLPKLDEETLLKAEEMYTAQGFTTVQEGRALKASVLETMAKTKFKVDVVAYADLETVVKSPSDEWWISRDYSKSSNGHFRTGGVKLTLDGSPQGRSAWFLEKYKLAPDDRKDDKDYKGFPNFTDEKRLTELIVRAYNEKWQLMVHANGDAAIQQLIDVSSNEDVQKAAANDKDRRTVLIHGQFLRTEPDEIKKIPNQTEKIKELGIFPSLFPMHTFYWGDWYRKILGEKRANNISPTKTVLDKKMIFSIHSDAPVTKPNSMRLLDSAVNRTTRTNKVLGAGQKIDPIIALKALTIWPAYQHFEEDTKGSIEVKKIADLVVVNRDPMHVDPRDIICIQILQTIKRGEQVYPTKGKLPLYRDGTVDAQREYDRCVKKPH